MATNKNQHFVPRCHLRPFSLEGQGRCIDVFNIDRMRLIQRAAVKHQCSGDYFYGEDQNLEMATQKIERAYGTVLKYLLVLGSRPSDDHRHVMRLFWFFQYMRTEAAARKSIEMLESMGDAFQMVPEEFNMGIKESVEQAMHVFASEMNLVKDVNVAFGRNRTNMPLVTSDNPAVLCNRWHQEDPSCKGMSIGLVSSGNMMVLPLSPDLVFIGYDSGIYSIPKNHGRFSISREADIDALNHMQVLNCNANLFIPPGYPEPALFNMVSESKGVRSPISHKTHYFVKDGAYPGHTRWRGVDRSDLENHQEALVQVQPIHPKPRCWPSCIKWRRRGIGYTDGSAVGYVRSAVARSKSDRGFKKVNIRNGRIQ